MVGDVPGSLGGKNNSTKSHVGEGCPNDKNSALDTEWFIFFCDREIFT